MNEAVIRSPKWLRNFADFEINTGSDIKGEPSKNQQKKMEEERLRKEEEERQQKLKEEEERREREKKENDELFQTLFKVVVNYIFYSYKDCDISISRDNRITIERHDLVYSIDGKLAIVDFEFKVTLLNDYTLPKFDIEIIYGKKILNYTIQGLVYITLKNHILNTVYPYYKLYGNKKKSSNKSKQYSKSSNYYKSQPKESEEKSNKRRRFNLLKNTLNGYERELNRLKREGAKQSEIEIVKNQIENVKDKINNMNKEFQFESVYYLKHLKNIFS